MRSFLTRLLVAAVAIPAFVYVFYQGGEWLQILIAVLAVAGVLEAQRLAAKAGASFAVAPAVLLTLAIPWIGGRYIAQLTWPIWLTLVVVVAAFSIVRSSNLKASAASVAGQIACVLWIGLGFGALLGLRQLPDGLGFWWLILLFANLWVGDTSAYLFGVWLGKAKLAPAISPNKTIAGSIAQVIASVAVGVVFATAGWIDAPALLIVCASLLIGVVGQVGDLFESVLKRAAGEKESSTIIPGHGGVLDRFDSALLAAPSLYVMLNAWPR